MSDSFQGGCACGAIRYLCAAKPVVSFNCHCRACQRFTGSAFISGMLVPAAAFRLTRGEPTYYTRQGDSGGDISRGFCAVCGSPVVARFSLMPESVGIPAGSLDESLMAQAHDRYVSFERSTVGLHEPGFAQILGGAGYATKNITPGVLRARAHSSY